MTVVVVLRRAARGAIPDALLIPGAAALTQAGLKGMRVRLLGVIICKRSITDAAEAGVVAVFVLALGADHRTDMPGLVRRRGGFLSVLDSDAGQRQAAKVEHRVWILQRFDLCHAIAEEHGRRN